MKIVPFWVCGTLLKSGKDIMVVRDAGQIEWEYSREKWPEFPELADGFVAAGEHSMLAADIPIFCLNMIF